MLRHVVKFCNSDPISSRPDCIDDPGSEVAAGRMSVDKSMVSDVSSAELSPSWSLLSRKLSAAQCPTDAVAVRSIAIAAPYMCKGLFINFSAGGGVPNKLLGLLTRDLTGAIYASLPENYSR